MNNQNFEELIEMSSALLLGVIILVFILIKAYKFYKKKSVTIKS